jgi:hypothetical protein
MKESGFSRTAHIFAKQALVVLVVNQSSVVSSPSLMQLEMYTVEVAVVVAAAVVPERSLRGRCREHCPVVLWDLGAAEAEEAS